MKHWTKKCMVLFLCLCLAGCGSRTENYLASETETQVAKEQESQETGEKETNGTVTVYVCGEVVSPGVYVLEEGARIGDAVETAGGFTKSASRDYWNLAELLTDGQMIRFPTAEEAKERDMSAGAEGTSAEPQSTDSGRVNLNTADVTQLMTIPGIGQTRAEAILSYREEHGPFSKPEDIMKVSGIKNALFEKMKDYITIR